MYPDNQYLEFRLHRTWWVARDQPKGWSGQRVMHNNRGILIRSFPASAPVAGRESPWLSYALPAH
jgi:hypothetical protein